MKTDDEKNDLALVRRPASAVERTESGAKRVLAVMVSETLTIALSQRVSISNAATSEELDNWCRLARKFYFGEGVPQDYIEAVKWFRKAAEKGNPNAQCNLAVCYEDGNGVPQDDIEVVKWTRMAAEQGHAIAQCVLARRYESGEGVDSDKVEAYKWFRLSAEKGEKDADKKVVSIAALMSPVDLQEAERRIAEFKTSHPK